MIIEGAGLGYSGLIAGISDDLASVSLLNNVDLTRNTKELSTNSPKCQNLEWEVRKVGCTIKESLGFKYPKKRPIPLRGNEAYLTAFPRGKFYVRSPLAFMAANIAVPMSAGDSTTVIPHSAITRIFSAAVPLPPATIAPACPIRRPGGAV